MTSGDWNPEQYEKYRNERSQPFFDLVGMLKPAAQGRVVDLGCGTGELTRVLHERLGAAETVGLDNSDAMLAKSMSFSGSGVRFEKGDVRAWRSGGLDVVFSNAALHWVEEHPTLFRRLHEALAPNGQLAVQLPANHQHATHWVAHELVQRAPFRQALGGYVRHVPVLKPREYAELLQELGFKEQQVVLRVYGHVLPSRGDLVEWVKGSLLTDYEKRMSSEMFERFLVSYREALFEVVPDVRPHFFTFERILLWARK